MYNGVVSVLIPLYNAQGFIESAIKSAQAQTYRNLEIKVLDDGSTDASAAIVKRMAGQDSRINYSYQDNKGVAAARNRLIGLAKGEYLAFLDQDDHWYADKLRCQLELFDRPAKPALVFGDMLCVSGKGGNFSYFSKRRPYRGDIFYEFLFKGNFIPVSSVIVKSSIIRRNLPFRAELTIAEDWEMFLRIAKDYNIDYLDQIVGVYQLHDNRLSAKNILREINESEAVLDYWSKKQPAADKDTKRRFRRSKAALNQRRAYFYKSNRDFSRGRKEYINCIRTDPTWISGYLKLLKFHIDMALVRDVSGMQNNNGLRQ